MTDPTDRQLEVLRVIWEHTGTFGAPPTIREIGDELTPRIRSTNGVNDHLRALEAKGLIQRGEMKARTVELTARGRVAIGAPSCTCRCHREVA